MEAPLDKGDDNRDDPEQKPQDSDVFVKHSIDWELTNIMDSSRKAEEDLLTTKRWKTNANLEKHKGHLRFPFMPSKPI